MKSPPKHMQTMIDSLDMFNYICMDDKEALDESIKSFCDQIDFYGNQVLKMDKDLDSKWINAHKEVNKAIKSFVLMNIDKLCKWPGTKDSEGSVDHFNSLAEQALKGPLSSGPA